MPHFALNQHQTNLIYTEHEVEVLVHDVYTVRVARAETHYTAFDLYVLSFANLVEGEEVHVAQVKTKSLRNGVTAVNAIIHGML